ncbi:allantoinase AllB [soil metagenome]
MSEQYELVVGAASALLDGAFGPAFVGVTGGRIAAVSQSALEGRDLVMLSDDEVLIPGLVDSHVHINEPGRTEWEGFASATRAAAAGGVTTVIDMPLNSIPATVTPAALDAKRAAAAPQASVDVGFWGGAIPSSLGHLRELHERGVFGFKCFLAPSGVDEFPHLDTAQLNQALDEVASFGGLLIVHAEDPGVLEAHVEHAGGDYHRFVRSRPPEAEITAIQNVIDGVRRSGARAHILHLSSAAALPALTQAKAEGLPISVETCPHYLTITEEQVPDGATQFKCCPPIRDETNRELLWEALLDGTIDIVVTDHSPSTAELKFAHGGDFELAWGGIAGLQTGLAAVWTEASRRGVPLQSVLQWMSRGPADLIGLASKGRIAPGADADLVAFAPQDAFTVDAQQLLQKKTVSAFDGRELHGVARRIWLAGTPLSPGADPRGRLLQRP